MHAGALHSGARRRCGEIGGALRLGDVALFDPRALDDPLVARLDADLREIVVREDRSGDTASRAREIRDRSLHDALVPAPRRRPMCSSISDSTACTATLIAF